MFPLLRAIRGIFPGSTHCSTHMEQESRVINDSIITHGQEHEHAVTTEKRGKTTTLGSQTSRSARQ